MEIAARGTVGRESPTSRVLAETRSTLLGESPDRAQTAAWALVEEFAAFLGTDASRPTPPPGTAQGPDMSMAEATLLYTYLLDAVRGKAPPPPPPPAEVVRAYREECLNGATTTREALGAARASKYAQFTQWQERLLAAVQAWAGKNSLTQQHLVLLLSWMVFKSFSLARRPAPPAK